MTTAEARTITTLQAELHRERVLRLKAEQKAGGLRAAVVKLQAALAQRKAD